MNASANKESNRDGNQGEMEKKVDTVDYRSSAGQDQPQAQEQMRPAPPPPPQAQGQTRPPPPPPPQAQAQAQPVQVVHQIHDPPPMGKNTSGSILANAAASIAPTLQSAKEAISQK